MSDEQVISNLIEGAAEGSESSNNVSLALQEVVTLLQATDESLLVICQEVEGASSREELKVAFKRLNKLFRLFIEVDPEAIHSKQALEAVLTLSMSDQLRAVVLSAGSVGDAAAAYKTAIMQGLAVKLRRSEEQERVEDEKDEELFAMFLPKLALPTDQLGGVGTKPGDGLTGSRKRGSSAIGLDKIPWKSKIPALTALSRVSVPGNDGNTPKKNVIMTREKLRAGINDPRGLLNLVGTSTNALERTKKLELLKTSGFLFNKQGPNSFENKLEAAKIRLDLGLGGHTVEDTLLFGAKEMSSPGYLLPKNITEIENNIVDSDST